MKPVYIPKNEEIQIRLRRYRDGLALSGGMVIVLSLWDIIKVFIGLFLGKEPIAELIENAMDQGGNPAAGTEYEKTASIIIWVLCLLMILLICAAVFLYHLYIGVNAIRAGRQTAKKRNRLYIVLTFLNILFGGIFIILNICDYFGAESGNADLAYYMMEVTGIINNVFILYAANKIGKLEKAWGETR